jgi:aspartate aminotransferase-like enzyme
MHIKKLRLLTPGPTPLLPKALHAMMGSDIHHRTADFKKLFSQTLLDLKEVFGTRNDVLMLVASGSGAMDASVSNFFSCGDKVIACVAGKFGERWEGITKAYGLNAVILKAEYGDTVSPERLAEALQENPDAKGVFIQACETSTGAAHDIKTMAEMIAKTEAIFVVDAITGFGTQTLDIDGWGLDVVISGSQKTFMIPPGLAFLSVSEKAWKLADSSKSAKFYFDLKKERKAARAGDPTWTPAVSLVLALSESLKYIKDLGVDKMVENAQLLARATRNAATELGLELFSPKSPAGAVTAIRPPKGMDSGVIVKGFRSHFGSIITNGQGSMEGQIFRLAHLGYFDIADVFTLVSQLEIILHANGHTVEFGRGVAAAQRTYVEAAFPVAVGVK